MSSVCRPLATGWPSCMATTLTCGRRNSSGGGGGTKGKPPARTLARSLVCVGDVHNHRSELFISLAQRRHKHTHIHKLTLIVSLTHGDCPIEAGKTRARRLGFIYFLSLSSFVPLACSPARLQCRRALFFSFTLQIERTHTNVKFLCEFVSS